MAPQVRDLQTLINQYSSAFDPQKALIDTQIQQNDQSGAAQEAGLTAKKDQAFTQIGQDAQNHGMFFSGFTPDEQAKYTANTYLPALAQLQSTIANTRTQLLGKKAEMDTNAQQSATAAHEQDVRDVNAYNQREQELAQQAAEAEKQRQFEAQQNALKIAADERQAAASRSAAAAGQPTNQELFASELAKSVGKDGKVSPGTFQALKHQWVAAGYGSAGEFTSKFWNFANAGHWWDYYYG